LSRFGQNLFFFGAIIGVVKNFLLAEIWAENQNTFEQVLGQ
jgi:hypothetical protein